MTNYKFKFHPYQRPFKHPLSTSHGKWTVREGIILSLSDEIGNIGWGEIAPIPWFGSETLEQAFNFCEQLPQEITTEEIFAIPAELPCCQFGFESAWELVMGKGLSTKDFEQSKQHYSYLLPSDETAKQSWEAPWNQGYRSFKWKIGIAPIEDEIKIVQELVEAIPASAQLRLDANGGLTKQEADQWLMVCETIGAVEFIEQPLPPEQFDVMLEMSHNYSTAIALDESVATLDQLEQCYQRGWRGIFVIKAAIAGSRKRLRQFCDTYPIDTVFSSALETTIGQQAVLQLAAELSDFKRAVGFGVNHWFNEG
ncbi:MAG: o-succinylbenzoate synthase [Moorea sp. SIO4G2]|nr:o-succinylbenzoate synthase [Moorena sp. SIO4G2]